MTPTEHCCERLVLAQIALIRTGYFTADEVSGDIAPRIIEMWSAAQADLEQYRRAVVTEIAMRVFNVTRDALLTELIEGMADEHGGAR